MPQLGLFDTNKEEYQVDYTTTVRLEHRSAQIALKTRRKQAWQKLKEIIAGLEGKDILVSMCDGPRGHFWFNDLLLRHMKAECLLKSETCPSLLVLWGTRRKWGQQNVRIFLDQLVDVRTQDYDGPYYLIDFWNGWGEYPLDKYKMPGSQSIQIRPAAKQ